MGWRFLRHPFVAFYIASNSTVYMMEADTDATTSGQAMAQTGGPFTTSSLTGNYGLQFSGVDAAADGVEIDFFRTSDGVRIGHAE
jgi:hypothetical protein